MRSAYALATLILLATPAAADTFGGFSGVDKPYLVNQDKICVPLAVTAGTAKGAPMCETVTADIKAKLSIKEPIAQRGIKATFAATASGRTLTVTKKTVPKPEMLVTWQAPDAIGKIVEVYTSQYDDRVAVAYTIRRLGKEVTDVVAFELIKTMGTTAPTKPTTTPTEPPPTTPTKATPAAPTDPKLDKAVAVARKAPKGKAQAAWEAVLAIDSGHSEARYRLATIAAGLKRTGDAVTHLETLSKSTRGEAVEWLVEARFDKAFAGVRAESKFRGAVGLDRAPASPYERLMGLGGQWEQTETNCDKPQVNLTLSRDRAVKLRVKASCRGNTYDIPFKGTWRVSDDGIVLTLPTKGKAATAKDEAPCTFEKEGDEDALHCVIDKDLDFTVLPTRR